MRIDLLFITYNRLHYTKLSLASVLADSSEDFALTIWDNASSDGTVEYLKNDISDPRIKDIVFSTKNVGQTAALNAIWSRSDADLLGKLDNDCIVSPGWTRTLARAHQDIDQLGVIACWHFFPDDFDYDRAQHKIYSFGRHQILRHPWTCGTGLLVKRSTFSRFGPFKDRATTSYWLNVASGGYINGFYYPLIHQEHMDDPRSQHNSLKTTSFEDAYRHSYGWQTGALSDLESYHRLHNKILDNLLDDPWDPQCYCLPVWKRLCRRVLRTANGIRRTL
jgi:glycosyltransferase involved in cell wall biosynthesis